MSEKWYHLEGWQFRLISRMPETREDVVSFLSFEACGAFTDLHETEDEALALAREHYEEERQIWTDALESLNGDYVTRHAIYRFTPKQTEQYRQEYTQRLKVAERALALCQ